MSTISASTTTTTAYKVTADTTGTLVLQTGASPTTAVTIDTSQNVGIGVTPSGWGSGYSGLQILQGLSLAATAGNAWLANDAYFNGTNWIYTRSSTYANNIALNPGGSGGIAFNIAPSGTAGSAITFTQAMTLDASGRLGIGTSSPAQKLHVYAATGSVTGKVEAVGGQASLLAQNTHDYIQIAVDGTNCYVDAGTGSPLLFYTASAERMRLDTSGNLLVGQTSSGLQNSNSAAIQANGTSVFNHANGTASGNSYITFAYNAGIIGSITQNGTTGVLFNTTSDYRLKTVIGAVSGFGERIDALEPVEYEWKANGEHTRGFLAHKFQEVYPQSVSGEKDAVDADGNPVYQNMQASTSEVIADLVAEIQSLRKRLTALENK